MPELPEVETIKNQLLTEFSNCEVQVFESRTLHLIKKAPTLKSLNTSLSGQRIRDIKRYGKFLLFEFDRAVLRIHLGMSGRMRIIEPSKYLEFKHIHLTIKFKNGLTLAYIDPRRFGSIEVVNPDFKIPPKLGPDALDLKLGNKLLSSQKLKSSVPIKLKLLDQSLVAGIGNIYSDEILYRSHLSPLRKATSLSGDEILYLTKNIRKVLKQAIRQSGSTLQDGGYVDLYGANGKFQNYHLIHAKSTCTACQSHVSRVKLGGRSCYYCSMCQH